MSVGAEAVLTLRIGCAVAVLLCRWCGVEVQATEERGRRLSAGPSPNGGKLHKSTGMFRARCATWERASDTS
jgi:hypothetical protein